MSTVEDTRTLVRVIGSISQESLVQNLTDTFKNLNIQFEPIDTATLESQQLDEAARIEKLRNLKDELEQNLNGARPTGALQLFLISDGGVAAGDPDSQATLRALAKAALSDPSSTVAAMLPENGTGSLELPSQLPEAVRSVVREFLQVKGVPVIHTDSELTEYFQKQT